MMVSTLRACACLLVLTAAVWADPVITVYGALAPNGYGSPSYTAWQSNAVNALRNGLSSNGNPNLPTYYQQVSTVSQQHILVTSFPSWLGQVNPGTTFGAAFANELGNRLLFGLSIIGNDRQFSISELSFTAHSTDPFDGLQMGFAAGAYNYGPGYVGVQKGSDGLLGTADDVLITSGSNTQMVDALFGRGSGNGYWPCAPGDPTPCGTPAEKQAAMDAAGAYNAPDAYVFTGTYALTGGGSGTASIAIVPTPEPSSVLLLSGVLVAAGAAIRRKVRRS